MKVAIGALASSGIETHLGLDLPSGVGAAVSHYVGGLRSGRHPVAVPPWLQQGLPSPKVEVELEVDEEIEAALEREAERQAVGVAELAAHAALVYLAELDSRSQDRSNFIRAGAQVRPRGRCSPLG